MSIGSIAAFAALSLLQPWPLASVSPEHEDFSDLKPFAAAIGKARVVALAEQSHGGREEFLLKTRLLKYLHQELGFDVLLLESGFYDLGQLAERAKRGEALDDSAPGNVFFMYAKSSEGRGLLRYLDQQRQRGTPIDVAGIDSQHTGALSNDTLLPRLQGFLRQRAPALADGAGWDSYARAAAPLFAMQRAAPAAAIQSGFERHHQALQTALCMETSAAFEGALWWCQVVRSVHAQATSYWSGERNYQRDNQMGANAIWLADQVFAGKKVVVWAHTIHVARGLQRAPEQLQAGEVMHRHWGPDYKVVQFSAASGEVLDYATLQGFRVPLPAPDSVEAALAADPRPLLGLSAAPAEMPQSSFDYGQPVVGKLGVNWDLLLFTRTMHPVHMER
jgi:erythromycin esterase